MENQIEKVRNAYETMIYRDVIKYGFHEFVSIRDSYLINCGKFKPRADLVERYIYLQLLFIYPIVPHFCEVSYVDFLLSFTSQPANYPKFIGYCEFPKVIKQINYSAIRSHQYMSKFLSSAR